MSKFTHPVLCSACGHRTDFECLIWPEVKDAVNAKNIMLEDKIQKLEAACSVLMACCKHISNHGRLVKWKNDSVDSIKFVDSHEAELAKEALAKYHEIMEEK